MPGSLELIAVVSGAACVAGLLLAVVALVGTRRPPGRARVVGPASVDCGADRAPPRLSSGPTRPCWSPRWSLARWHFC